MDALVAKEDELGHGRRDSSELLYAPALKGYSVSPDNRPPY
jgi:hypothetical protein